jgi:complement component 1 Q subcomponent-binding protein
LSNEISEESGNQEIDQELIDVQKQVLKVFKLKEEAGLSNVILTRKHGDEIIEVEFDVQDVEENEPEYEDEEENEEEAMAGMGINFTVRIKKGDNTMIVDAFASDAMNIRNIRYVDAKHAGEKFESNHYEGPNFEELEESLQAAFYEYLTERNIDDDLSFFVLAYSRDKEQREYVNWLEKVQSFTADK